MDPFFSFIVNVRLSEALASNFPIQIGPKLFFEKSRGPHDINKKVKEHHEAKVDFPK